MANQIIICFPTDRPLEPDEHLVRMSSDWFSTRGFSSREPTAATVQLKADILENGTMDEKACITATLGSSWPKCLLRVSEEVQHRKALRTAAFVKATRSAKRPMEKSDTKERMRAYRARLVADAVAVAAANADTDVEGILPELEAK